MYRERSNGKDYFKMEIEEGQALDMIAIRMMEENVMQGIMPFRKVNAMEGTYFEYEVPGQDSLNDWLAVTHGKNEVISVLNSLIQINDESEVNLLETNHLYTEKEWISVTNDRCYMAYIPYVSYFNNGLLKLAEEIVNKVSVLQNENFNYIYDLRNAFSSDEIVSMVDLKKWLNSVQGQDEAKQQGESYQEYGIGQSSVGPSQMSMQGQQPMAGQNMWNNPMGMNGMPNQPQNQMGGNEPFGAMNSKKKEEKGPKKPLFAKKEKNVAPMQQTPGMAGGSPFDEFFDNTPQKKAVPQNPSNMPSGMNSANQGNKPVQGNMLNQPVPPMGQPMDKEEKAKSGGKFKMPSFGAKKQSAPSMGQPVPSNGRQPMPPMGQPMPPMGQPMPPMGQPMPSNGRPPMPPMGQPMSANGRQPMPPMGQPMPPMGQPMPPMGQPMSPMGQPMSPMGQPMSPVGQPVPPNGKIINELEFENDGTVLMSQSSVGSIRCKDFPNGLSLDKDSYILGIGQQADIRITGNSTVSRKHARIYKQAGAFYIVDEGSLNGTYVNNRQLMAHEPCKLEDGAKILLSDESIIFEAR